MRWRKKQTRTLARMVEVLKVTPADRLVVTCPHSMTPEQATHVRRAVAEFAGIEVERVLAVANATVSVLRHGDAPPPPVYIAPAKEF